MVALANFFDSIRGFIELGGDVLWAILVVLLMMWTLILERYWYYFRVLPTRRREILDQWKERTDRQSWHAGRIREELINRLSQEMQRNIRTIQTLIAVCPLLGLLGTVTGMVAVFDVMAFFGTGNARAMAAGVSQATIPTMAGMVAALSGLYFGSFLERKSEVEAERLEDLLRFD
ncbi:MULTISPECIES: MotA/TolQ/ExbB proton channel family protein [unclassified Wenzhouxiangella]|uniref:MotA/TolQ/ExbB proton channel family protein n=1 Tax=unclassified Wenzhouxiangella TaxID=2613841 RepID=UPI000E328B58|nr:MULTISPECIES: MotA/TolQ/ExbB proton channel family protein [unclassified Wenzhouxiangella]RFF27745.1 MotA/TolQ/ExbB proton channel family protein [Wenzhouxiangella sp. 15181]RFP69048.1 MotA/TolQ/ExbB proton channel family protein [Wenzhouxiangella sp. 15190]